ncbi:MAG: polyphenol oxidase family protein [Actinomycetota bacterium]
MSELTWITADGVPYLTDTRAEQAGLRVAFTTRRGGRSGPPFDTLNLSDYVGDEAGAVADNRRTALAACGFEPDSLATLRQVHGTDVIEVGRGACGSQGEADALATGERGATLGVLAADCVPVLLCGSRGVAAAHAGWRGLVAGVLDAAVARVGADAAWVGPSIRACCYEVGGEVVTAFEGAGLPVEDERHVDPSWSAVVALQRAGVAKVASATECTSCDDRFFSFRRDGTTGRQAGLIALL